MSLLSIVLGRRLASHEQEDVKIGAVAGVPAMGLDGLTASAYGPEAALTILLPLGTAGLNYIMPVTGAILVVLAILYFSYRQTIAAYPVNGGSYTVAKENLGTWPSLVAAAAKVTEGAWITVLAIPLLLTLFKLVHNYYHRVEQQI